MKTWTTFLNVAMGTFVGLWIGRAVYVLWRHQVHPEFYGMQSAPWYTSIWVDGVFMLAALAICLLVKLILKSVAKKKANKSGK